MKSKETAEPTEGLNAKNCHSVSKQICMPILNTFIIFMKKKYSKMVQIHFFVLCLCGGFHSNEL